MAFDLPAMSGLLACNKPLGLTSRDCVNAVERILRQRFPRPQRLPKVGHAGTLDPLATGVLVMGIGLGVRMVPYIQQMTKHYDATFRLGCWSETGDLEGELHHEDDPCAPTFEQLHEAAAELIGDITQTPPMTSAVRINGKKAYQYAHRGIAVEVPSRIVRIDSILITRYEYPDVDLSIVCGSGTYIRTLGMDLAISCQTRAVMNRLQRTKIGKFDLAVCHEIDQLKPESIEQAFLPLIIGVSQLPSLQLTIEQTIRLMYGQKIAVDDVPRSDAIETEAIVCDNRGDLQAIVRRSDGAWCPYRVFHQQG